jgi:DNA-binding response OmpR family regulator
MEHNKLTPIKSAPVFPRNRLLVVDDDVLLCEFLSRYLQSQHNQVDVVNDGDAALQALSQTRYNLLILELNLPKRDGISVLQEIRPRAPMLSILVLTARSRLEDKIMALDSGADDCVVKPFLFQELVARVRALLRRNVGVSPTAVQVGDLILSRSERRAERAGKKFNLTRREFLLLEYLMLNSPQAVTREMLLENVWNRALDNRTNVINVYVKYLRDKLDKDFPTKLIQCVRGVGFALRDE